MMPPIVAPQVVRYAVQGTIHDRPWANIWDVEIQEGRPGADAEIQQTAIDLLDHYATYFGSVTGGQWYVSKVSWVDLNTVNGQVGSVNDTPTKTFPYQGVVGGDTAPGNVAFLIQKTITGGRNSRNGRCFVPGLPESSMQGNKLPSTLLTTLTTNMNNFRNAMNASVGGTARQLVVVSRPKTGIIGIHPVSALSPVERLATIRQRLRA